jgi:competence protein ComEA
VAPDPLSASRIPHPVSRIPFACAGPISLNHATPEQLACLPGIGPALAARIVTWRTAHGAFAEVAQLEQVPGIGAARARRLAALVRLP